MAINYSITHTYTEENAKRIVSQLNFAEMKEDEEFRWRFNTKAVEGGLFKIAVFDENDIFTAYW